MPAEVAVKQKANDAIQILAAMVTQKDFPVEKFYRDAKLCTIGEEHQKYKKLVIARESLHA